MNIASLLFLFLSVGFYAMVQGLGLDLYFQFYMCIPWILLLGIPHGAVDHILYKQVSSLPASRFYLLYLSTMGLYFFVWLFAPHLAIILFLLLSAFHFGQSQWGRYATIPTTIRNLISFSWGGFILSVLFLMSPGDLQQISGMSSDLQFFNDIFSRVNLTYATACFSTLILVWYGLIYVKNWISRKTWWTEVGILTLIILVFVNLPLLPAFTAYFAMLHSLRMLEAEYNVLHQNMYVASFSEFIVELLPLTILSVVGGTVLWLLIEFQYITLSLPFLFIILIAIITFPHSIVMHSLYKKEIGAFME